MAMGMLTSCGAGGSSKNADGKTVITVGDWPQKEGTDKDNMEEAKAKFEAANTDVEIKPVVLSYIQRGGAPTAADRMLATRLGARAVELIHEGVRNRALGIHDNHIVDVDIKDSTAHNENYDQSLYDLHSKMNRIY